MIPELEAQARTQAVAELAVTVFRVHAALVAHGDAVVAPLGLTSARWQVLGTIDEAGEAPTVPAIAAAMGLSRQAIQKQVDLLLKDGLVAARANPAHARSPRFQTTGAGKAALARADQRWASQAAELSEGISAAALAAGARVLEELGERLRASLENPALGG